MTSTSKELSNSSKAIVVDFNTEMSAIVNNTSTAQGRELKLACAIYQTPEVFKLAELLSAAKVNGKTKRERQIIATSAACTTFANIAKEHASATEAAKKARGTKKLELQETVKATTKLQAAALRMFESALYGAYFFMCIGAVLESKPTDRVVKVRATRSLDQAGVKVDNGTTDHYKRSQIAADGKKLVVARGMQTIKVTAKAGAGVTPNAGTSTATIAGELAKAIGALTTEASDEFIGSATSNQLFGSLVRKLFCADGQIVIADVIAAIRSNDVLQGVNIVKEVKPAKAA